MRKPYFLGIDVGTTMVKALVADQSGAVVGTESLEYSYSQPHPGWAEHDAHHWWECIKNVTSRVTAKLSHAPIALAVATQGDAMLPVDARNEPMLPARMWMDSRPNAQVHRMLEQLPEEKWRQIAGSGLAAYAAAASLAWWADEYPQVFAQAAHFCLLQDYLMKRMTNQYVVDASNASRTLIMDLQSRNWSERLMAVAGVDSTRLATVAESGTPVGHLTSEAAADLGLSQDTLVVLGAHDQTAAAVGCGAVFPGTVMLSAGSSWVLLGAADGLHIEPQARLQTYCHAFQDGSAILTAYPGGALLRWARDHLSQLPASELSDYSTMTAEAQAAESSDHNPLIFLPHFYGAASPKRSAHARGALLGLQLNHNRGDVILALMRGVATQTAAGLATMAKTGYHVGEVRMIGGAARSSYWAQLVADACGRTIRMPEVAEAAAYGAAMLAAIGAGYVDSVQEVAEMITIHREITPRRHAVTISRRLHARYLQALDDVWGQLAEYRGKYQ
jgi:xylulokinase